MELIPIQASELARTIVQDYPDITLVLFGSFARDEHDDRSDIDILVLGECDEDTVRGRAEQVRHELDERLEMTREFSFLFARSWKDVDESLRMAIAAEGQVLLSRARPEFEQLASYVLLRYGTSHLDSTRRKKFYRALESTKLTNYKKGTVLLVPSSRSSEAERLLRTYEALRERIQVLMPS